MEGINREEALALLKPERRQELRERAHEVTERCVEKRFDFCSGLCGVRVGKTRLQVVKGGGGLRCRREGFWIKAVFGKAAVVSAAMNQYNVRIAHTTKAYISVGK